MQTTRNVAMAALICLMAAGVGDATEENGQAPTSDAGRLNVSASFGKDGGRIVSQKQAGNSPEVLHGIQVVLGPNNWMKEYSVYNDGALEQRTQFYPNGRMFRFQRREHNGDGYEVVYAPEPVKQEIVVQGTVKANRRWDGAFLVREPIPNGYGLRLVRHTYKRGDLVESVPFPVRQLQLPENHRDVDHWLWEFPDWPAAP